MLYLWNWCSFSAIDLKLMFYFWNWCSISGTDVLHALMEYFILSSAIHPYPQFFGPALRPESYIMVDYPLSHWTKLKSIYSLTLFPSWKPMCTFSSTSLSRCNNYPLSRTHLHIFAHISSKEQSSNCVSAQPPFPSAGMLTLNAFRSLELVHRIHNSCLNSFLS